jgi:hypothetical protein
MAAHGFDVDADRRLPARMLADRFVGPRVSMRPVGPGLSSDGDQLMERRVQENSDHRIDQGFVHADGVTRWLALLGQPGFVDITGTVISVLAQRPDGVPSEGRTS